MKHFYTGLFAVLAIGLLGASSLTPPDPSELMKKKTEHAQSILKALALADLPLVKKEAEAIEKLTVEAGFANTSEKYADYGREFLRIVRELIKEAENKNMAGSYYQFTRMTSVCFSCHEHLRTK
ncbi:MAG: hypothetical protein IPP94_14715 [Ignavibacteria bacterium]|nr:hypothetical protein [Ignavibacteria bacterium]